MLGQGVRSPVGVNRHGRAGRVAWRDLAALLVWAGVGVIRLRVAVSRLRLGYASGRLVSHRTYFVPRLLLLKVIKRGKMVYGRAICV